MENLLSRARFGASCSRISAVGLKFRAAAPSIATKFPADSAHTLSDDTAFPTGHILLTERNPSSEEPSMLTTTCMVDSHASNAAVEGLRLAYARQAAVYQHNQEFCVPNVIAGSKYYCGRMYLKAVDIFYVDVFWFPDNLLDPSVYHLFPR